MEPSQHPDTAVPEALAQALAEAQRERDALQRRLVVEDALERVRDRTMAMHRSDELREVVAVLFEQIQPLGFESFGCSIIICDEAAGGMEIWYSSDTQAVLPQSYHLPLLDHPYYEEQWNTWKDGVSYTSLESSGDLKRSWDRLVLEKTDLKELPEAIKASLSALEKIIGSLASMRHGLLAAWGVEALPDDKALILQRFARVFEQTYTRFLDLKKAEAQAREAQIEAALERVRARAMAMHNSEELGDAAVLLYKELKALGITNFFNCGYVEVDEKNEIQYIWVSNSWARNLSFIGHTLPLVGDAVLQDRYEGWKRQDPVFHQEVHGEERYKHLDYVSSHLGSPEWEETLRAQWPDPTIFYCCNFPQGYLHILTDTLLSAEKEALLVRFTRVFEQTYTRFLDLKRAEEQAREAQIEAALERVRARAMGMHQSDELREVITVIFEQLQGLGIDSSWCAIGIYDADTRASDWWQADAEGAHPKQYHVPYLDGVWFKNAFKAWQQQVPYSTFVLSGEEKKHNDHLFSTGTDYKDMPEESYAEITALERMVFSHACLKHGMLEVVGVEELPEEKADIIQRFARVIDLTYTRFDDLQQAEARAREAVRQASLDRVRAEIASMRTADDLQRITPLVWRELTTLGVPFFRCGVFIIDEDAQTTHTYLSTPDGTSLAALHLPFDSTRLVQETVSHWRRRQVYTDQWDRQQFAAWVAALVEQGHLDATEAYQGGEAPPASLALHFLPFTQGMLYVGSSAPLSDEEIALGQALADAFSVAYARYEDFTKLEAAKARVEATLADLKAMQTQLIHAEKMASLGQMTAGIAHEIKNPLNFVNNFAELNEELAQELTDELHQLEAYLPNAAADDFKDALATMQVNAAQIAKHGRRADDIVKSMMQHAREGTSRHEPTAINALVEEYVNLAFHGMRASQPGFTPQIERDYSEAVGQAPVLSQELGRVLMNLLSNAFYAVDERAGRSADGYTPTVTVATRVVEAGIEIRVRDNGPGIPPAVKDRIFEPFFTTKPTGSGTGLGLSLSYDIVTQGHGGTLTVETEEGAGATFVITLPHEAKPTDAKK